MTQCFRIGDSDATRRSEVSGRLKVQMLLIYPRSLLALILLHTFAPQRSGPLALTQVFEPYFFFPLLPILWFIRVKGTSSLRVALVLCAILLLIRNVSLPGLFSQPYIIGPKSINVRVMSWNVHNTTQLDQIFRLRPLLVEQRADIVLLMEAYGTWIRHDPELSKIYSVRISNRTETSPGLIVLSKYPILETEIPTITSGTNNEPHVLVVRLDLGQGRTLRVIATHLEAPATWLGQGAGHCQGIGCYDATKRDRMIPLLRLYIDPSLQTGEDIILAGDLNLTSQELGYSELVKGLQDSHKVAGTGLGHTWPNISLFGWQISLLRIDHLFSSLGVTPLSTSVDCTQRGSDHCIVFGEFVLN